LTTRQKVSLIEKSNPNLSLKRRAKLLEIARSTLYYQPRVKTEDTRIMDKIDEIYTQYPFFGSRRIRAFLRRHDIHISREKTQGLMRRMGIQAVFPGPNTSKARQEHAKYPYLLRGFEIVRPDQVWGTDITYIRLMRSWAYLTVILDWFSRYVIAWALSCSLESSFCVETLKNALDLGRMPEIHNSDQGSQFTSDEYIQVLKGSEVKISMDGRGRCMDNIFTERLWRTVKYENVYLCEYEDLAAAKRGLDEYFKFYNADRPHQALDYRTPYEVYQG
jgi:putative transposase